MTTNKEVDNDFRVEQFKKFYDLLMINAPTGYKPWFFPCEKNGKNPCALAILNLDRESKGSWHHESARLDKDEVIKHILVGYNIGISGRNGDPLIVGDIDSIEYLDQLPKDTLTCISRKRCGRHFFGWDKDGTAKINCPTDHGEMRSNNQYVLCAGSYVALTSEDKSYNLLTEEAKNDKLLGYYTINTEIPPRELSFEDLPDFFKIESRKDAQAQVELEQKESEREYKPFEGEGKYSQLLKLKVADIVGKLPATKRYGHPLHDSDTDANFSLSKDGILGHCWRHTCSLNAVQYLCVLGGYCNCQDGGTPHSEKNKPKRYSKIKGDKKALDFAYEQALKLELIDEYVSSNIKMAAKIFTPKEQAKVFNDIQPLFYDKNQIWWLWNPSLFKWEIVDEVDILNMISESTGEDVITPKNRTIILNSLKQQGRKHIPKPIQPHWIQFKDTLFDILTGERFKASSEYFATNPLPWALHEENIEATPNMDRIFEEWVGADHVKTLYEILSYCMIPDYPVNRLFAFLGSGMNGKSKFLELLRNFIGGDNCCTTELDTLLNSRFEITRLHKKLVCMMGETNFNEMTKTSILKKLTGGDLIGFEYKNKNPFDEKNYAKILIATNNLPTTTDKTIGFYRRWMIIDFPNQFSEAKDILAEIPEEEYRALALKCCFILKEVLKERKFTNEGSVEERVERYEAKSNFFDKFLKEFTESDGSSFITSAEFYKKFQAWGKENRHREMSEVSVGMAMKKAGFESEKRYFNWMYDGKGGQAKCWSGIKWKN